MTVRSNNAASAKCGKLAWHGRIRAGSISIWLMSAYSRDETSIEMHQICNGREREEESPIWCMPSKRGGKNPHRTEKHDAFSFSEQLKER